MIQVSSSILSADFANLERDVRSLAPAGVDLVHVDVMDGSFVPNISIGLPVVEAIKRVSPLPLDVHLMIDRPVRYVERFCKAGANLLTVHIESDAQENILAALDQIADCGAVPAVALKPTTPAEAVLPYLSRCGMVLVMTVEPGFGGQKFMSHMVPKLKTIRGYINAQKPDCLLGADGGVNLQTASACKESGADVLIAGSAYFKAASQAEFVNALKAQNI